MHGFRNLAFATTSLLLLAIAGCDAEEPSSPSNSGACDGAKCDTPTGNDESCKLRESEVLDSTNRGFTRTDIRWACADVEGVNTVGGDDRGQEYCEYFAIFQPPAEEEGGELPQAVDLARNTGDRFEPQTAGSVCLEGDEGDHCRVTLTEDQQFEMEDNADAVVGSCVFTSWHSDTPGPLPACADGGCGDDAKVHGFPFTSEYFQMKVSFNSNRAAADLVAECFALTDLNERNPGRGYVREFDWEEGGDLQSPFFRGCVGSNALFGTGWRRSDPSVCAVANRLRECGCTAEGLDEAIRAYQEENPEVFLQEFDTIAFNDLPPVAQAGIVVGDVVVPPQPNADGTVTKRGFELATWDDREGLPPGCRYADTGEETQSLVLCDITAGDLLANANDPKEFCRATYGNNVVVHVPLPADAISCNPGDSAIGASCGETPWNIGAEG